MLYNRKAKNMLSMAAVNAVLIVPSQESVVNLWKQTYYGKSLLYGIKFYDNGNLVWFILDILKKFIEIGRQFLTTEDGALWQ